MEIVVRFKDEEQPGVNTCFALYTDNLGKKCCSALNATYCVKYPSSSCSFIATDEEVKNARQKSLERLKKLGRYDLIDKYNETHLLNEN